MLYTYEQCIMQCGSDYQLKNAVRSKVLYKLERGIYSDEASASELAIVTTKYPNAIITMDSAFYYHGLTDTIPDKIHMATEKSSWALNDSRVQQFFQQKEILGLGVTTMRKRDASFKIYDKERMLIELLRYKSKISYDLYKEIIGNYRRIITDLDIERIQEYAVIFPKSKMISKALEREVI